MPKTFQKISINKQGCSLYTHFLQEAGAINKKLFITFELRLYVQCLQWKVFILFVCSLVLICLSFLKFNHRPVQ